jgi:hypothetical protein
MTLASLSSAEGSSARVDMFGSSSRSLATAGILKKRTAADTAAATATATANNNNNNNNNTKSTTWSDLVRPSASFAAFSDAAAPAGSSRSRSHSPFGAALDAGDNDVFGTSLLQSALATTVEAAATACPVGEQHRPQPATTTSSSFAAAASRAIGVSEAAERSQQDRFPTCDDSSDDDDAEEADFVPPSFAVQRKRSFSLPSTGTRPMAASSTQPLSPCLSGRRRPSLSERRLSRKSLSIMLPSSSVANTEDTRADSWTSESLDNLFLMGAKYGSDVSLHLDPAAPKEGIKGTSPLAQVLARSGAA